jgi:hypothetical protein
MIFEAVCGGVEWIGMTQDRVPWKAVVNIAIPCNTFMR